MTTATEPAISQEEALWRAIGAAPEDALPRLVAADWFDEREEVVGCKRCKGRKDWHDALTWDGRCFDCSGTGVVSNGFAAMARALRATADRVPRSVHFAERKAWYIRKECNEKHDAEDISRELFNALSPEFDNAGEYRNWADYQSAEAAVRDLCRAYVKVHGEGV